MVAWGICTNKPLVVSSIPILVGNLLLYNVNNLILGYLHSYGIVLTVGEILTSTRQKSAVCPCRSILVACQPGNRWQPVAGAAGTGPVQQGILKITNEQVEQVFVGDYVGDVYSLSW